MDSTDDADDNIMKSVRIRQIRVIRVPFTLMKAYHIPDNKKGYKSQHFRIVEICF